MDSLKQYLNKQQLEAVNHTKGALLIIAGAGSGKTRVIEYRTLNLVSEGIPPEEILLLTFTRRAAEEMLERASHHNKDCRKVEGGTFHSFAFRQLKKMANAGDINLPKNFSVMDESDSEDLIHISLASLKIEPKQGKIPKKDTLKSIFSMSVNKGLTLEQVLEKYHPQFLEGQEEIREIHKEYTNKKIAKGYLDYDDLLIFLRNALKKDSLRNRWFSKYKFLMVDEYQDTNKLQGEISQLLGQHAGNVMAVGDDAQSIYGFRGATHENIMHFPRLFPNGKVLKLEENYRSTQGILDLANLILQKMESKYKKVLVSGNNLSGPKPNLFVFDSTYDEAEFIASKIAEMKNGGESLRKTAVLFRSSFISIPLQSELARLGINFKVFGGMKFYEMAHMKDLIAFFRVLINSGDELAWNRILGLLPKVGPKTADRIFNQIKNKDWQEIQKINFNDEFKNSQLDYFISNISQIALKAKKINEQIDFLIEVYSPLFREKFDDWQVRQNDFEMLKEIAWKYKNLEDLVADFILESPEKAPTNEDDYLTLSTIHSAKGLEWDNVFLIGAVDGVLPSKFSFVFPEETEEEKRLLYVAITRAKKQLFISMSKRNRTRGFDEWNRLSRFLDDPIILNQMEVLRFSNNEPSYNKKKNYSEWDDDEFNLDYL